ncbi:hypothetical protein B0H11DRAFT_2018099 [Mycena galericulata]|nr:hypothetical protein B0H11DRAFT_2018099 [Mycena galericulata]
MKSQQCPICAGKSNLDEENANRGAIQRGDVVRAEYTSVALPLLRYMATAGLLRGRPLETFNKLNDPDAKCGKTRPCVIVQPACRGESKDDTPWICLMTSLGNTSPERLQLVWQDFAIPIYPNLGSRAHSQHIHTYPEWSAGKSGWIIPIPMKSNTMSYTISDRWKSPTTPRGYRLAWGFEDIFRAICQRKTRELERKTQASSYTTQIINDLLSPPKRQAKITIYLQPSVCHLEDNTGASRRKSKASQRAIAYNSSKAAVGLLCH